MLADLNTVHRALSRYYEKHADEVVVEHGVPFLPLDAAVGLRLPAACPSREQLRYPEHLERDLAALDALATGMRGDAELFAGQALTVRRDVDYRTVLRGFRVDVVDDERATRLSSAELVRAFGASLLDWVCVMHDVGSPSVLWMLCINAANDHFGTVALLGLDADDERGTWHGRAYDSTAALSDALAAYKVQLDRAVAQFRADCPAAQPGEFRPMLAFGEAEHARRGWALLIPSPHSVDPALRALSGRAVIGRADWTAQGIEIQDAWQPEWDARAFKSVNNKSRRLLFMLRQLEVTGDTGDEDTDDAVRARARAHDKGAASMTLLTEDEARVARAVDGAVAHGRQFEPAPLDASDARGMDYQEIMQIAPRVARAFDAAAALSITFLGSFDPAARCIALAAPAPGLQAGLSVACADEPALKDVGMVVREAREDRVLLAMGPVALQEPTPLRNFCARCAATDASIAAALAAHNADFARMQSSRGEIYAALCSRTRAPRALECVLRLTEAQIRAQANLDAKLRELDMRDDDDRLEWAGYQREQAAELDRETAMALRLCQFDANVQVSELIASVMRA